MQSTSFIEEVITQRNLQHTLKGSSQDEIIINLIDRIHSLPKTGLKLISIVGGVACGKTTLAETLKLKLGNAERLSTDDYVIGTREFRRNEIVAKNKSPLEKYDFELLRDKIDKVRELTKGGTVKLPVYDSYSGLAVAAGENNFPKEVGKVDFLIIEGDFRATKEQDLLIYFHVNDATRTNNRIIRDQKERNESDLDKLKSDIETRDKQQHFPYTLPVAESADIIISAKKDNFDDKYIFDIYS